MILLNNTWKKFEIASRASSKREHVLQHRLEAPHPQRQAIGWQKASCKYKSSNRNNHARVTKMHKVLHSFSSCNPSRV